MAYIIDTYDRFNQWDRDHVVNMKLVGDIWSAIYAVELDADNLPRVDWNKEARYYYVYNELQDAIEYLEMLRAKV